MVQKRVEGGTTTTLDAERQRISAQLSVAQARAMLMQDYIALQKSPPRLARDPAETPR